MKKYIVFFILLSISGCKSVRSCAGVMTYRSCAKFCTHSAVAICEAGVKADINSSLDRNQRNINNLYNKNNNDTEIYEEIYGCKMGQPYCN
jgi:hypothetical protein